MNATQPSSLQTDLTVTHVLAELLERLGRSIVPAGAKEQYDHVNDQHAGLCRCALDASPAAEQQAKQALDRAMHRAMGRPTIQPKENPNHGKS